jgi:hypothetical protein
MPRHNKTTGKNPVNKIPRQRKTGSIERATLLGHAYFYLNTIAVSGSTQVLEQLNITPTLGDFN